MPTRSELIASSHTVDEIATYIGVESIGYLSEKGLFELTPFGVEDYCMACFNGKYAVEFEQSIHKSMHEDIQTSLLDDGKKS